MAFSPGTASRPPCPQICLLQTSSRTPIPDCRDLALCPPLTYAIGPTSPGLPEHPPDGMKRERPTLENRYHAGISEGGSSSLSFFAVPAGRACLMFHPNGLMSHGRCPVCVDSAAARSFALSSIGTGIAEVGRS
jgi:hypothetical protein